MSRFILPFQRVDDQNGHPLDGAKLYFFETGTDTPKDTYSDEGLTTPNTNPVIADSQGQFGNIFMRGIYRTRLDDKSDVTQPDYPEDNISGNIDTTLNITALKLVEGISNQRTYLLGYTTSGDGGEGQFYWDATSTDSDNGGTVIQATGVTTGRWKRLYSDNMHVEWFGAVGDGITDDTAKVQSALQAAFDAQCTLIDSAQARRFNSTLEIPGRGFKIKGAALMNLGQTTWNYYGSTGNLLKGLSTDMPYGNWWGGIEIEGIAFAQQGTSTDALVNFQGMIFSTFKLCRFLAANTSSNEALLLDYNCISNAFDQCDFQGADNKYGLNIQGFTETSPNLNKFTSCSFTGPATKLVTGVRLYATSTNYFEACQFEGLLLAASVEQQVSPALNSRYNTFMHCRFESCTNRIDWTTTSDINYVIAPYIVAAGTDLNDSSYSVMRFQGSSEKSVLGDTRFSGDTSTDNDKIKIVSRHSGAGIGIFSDTTMITRAGTIYQQGTSIYIKALLGNLNLNSNIDIRMEGGTNSILDHTTTNQPFRTGQLASDPSTGAWGADEKGIMWFNTTSNVYKYWNGTTIKTITAT